MRWPYVRFSTKRLVDALRRSGGGSYIDQIAATSPLVYFPMNETSGLTAVNYGTLASADGAYTGVTLADDAFPAGGSAPYFDGVNDRMDIYSAALAGAFDLNLGSFAGWVKAYSAAAYNDGSRHTVMRVGADANNLVLVRKSTTDSQIEAYHLGAATPKYKLGTLLPTSWSHVAFTWDDSADELWLYIDGAVVAGVASPLTTAIGTIASGSCNIGTTEALNYDWNGWIAHAALWDRALSDVEISALYNGGL